MALWDCFLCGEVKITSFEEKMLQHFLPYFLREKILCLTWGNFSAYLWNFPLHLWNFTSGLWNLAADLGNFHAHLGKLVKSYYLLPAMNDGSHRLVHSPSPLKTSLKHKKRAAL